MQFSEERIGRLLNELKNHIYTEEIAVSQYSMLQGLSRQYKPDELDFTKASIYSSGEPWIPGSGFTWFDTSITLPPSFIGAPVVFEAFTDAENGWAACNPQFMLYIDGKIRQGLDINHRQAMITDCAAIGQTFRLSLSGFADCRDQMLSLNTKLRCVNRAAEQYYYDLLVPYQIAQLQDRDSEIWHDLTTHLNASLNLLDLRRNSPRFDESLKAAHAYLKTSIYQRTTDQALSDEALSRASEPAVTPTVFCIGHTHIDVAWLWTLGITQDKTVRSFATVLALMDEYPEYLFMSSQPQLYQFIEQNAPELFMAIQEKVQAGRWETEGAMFVEADCNLASGEALVRQILYGKNYFADKFGQTNRILWLPDVFGYSAALPQIMKKSGIDYFMTTKISWNEVNKMPYDTFEWAGLDGTKVLTHFMPTKDYQTAPDESRQRSPHFTTYNGILNPSQVKGSWQRYQQKDLNRSVLMAYGFGDGGGGPTREMLETQQRLMYGLPGLPKVKPSSALAFFHQLEKEVKNKRNLPSWHGELYLEYHRGTYTSMARNKKYNRRAEFAWLNVEWLAVLADLLLARPYPKEEIAQQGQTILRNQFHDILPGSSIKEVYDESEIEYGQTFTALNQLRENLLSQFTQAWHGMETESYQGKQHTSSPAKDHQATLAVFNPSGLPTGSPILIQLPGTWQTPVIATSQGLITCQQISAAADPEQAGLTAWYPAQLHTDINAETDKAEARLDVDFADRPDAYDSSQQKSTSNKWLAYLPDVPAKGYQLYSIFDSAKIDDRADWAPAVSAESGKDDTANNNIARKHDTANNNIARKDDTTNNNISHRPTSGTKNSLIDQQDVTPSVSPTGLTNQFFKIELDQAGQIISCYDRIAGREIITQGKAANQLMSYEDKPLKYDAWDINAYYTEKSWPVDHVASVEITETGPLRWTLTITRRYLSSSIRQTISIWRDLPQIDLGYDIDWKEEQVLLKALFPVDVQSDKATFDIQYGNVERSTHSNTSWDAARFEVCVHKWLDISEDDYGLSLLNDCKYGCHVSNGVIGMTLIKSAIQPNPAADKERHRFMLSLRPHQGGWRQAGTVNAAYALNNPLITKLLPFTSRPSAKTEKTKESDDIGDKRVDNYHTPAALVIPGSFTLVSSNQGNMVIESVKQAEKDKAVIVRLYECYHRRTNCQLTFGLPLKKLALCNLMEETIDSLPYETNHKNQSLVRLTAKPYEIITLKAYF